MRERQHQQRKQELLSKIQIFSAQLVELKKELSTNILIRIDFNSFNDFVVKLGAIYRQGMVFENAAHNRPPMYDNRIQLAQHARGTPAFFPTPQEVTENSEEIEKFNSQVLGVANEVDKIANSFKARFNVTTLVPFFLTALCTQNHTPSISGCEPPPGARVDNGITIVPPPSRK